MVIVKFIQDGLKCQLEGETDTYKYSKNMEMQFVKDENHQDYEVTVFFLDQEKNEGKIDIDENGVFKVGERFFLRKEPFYLSFQLEKGDEIQHLGNYKMRVCDAIGNGSSPLPEDPKIWIEYVDEEMDKYFNENFQPKLDKFNADYEEIKKIAAGGGSGSSITVDSELNSTSKNPVQNKVIKAELDKKAAKNEIPTNLSSLNEDETHQTVTAEEKKKRDGKSDFDGDFNSLNNIPNIPDAVIVDAELNETSTNAIQNQAVTKELGKKIPKGGLKTVNGQSLEGDGNIQIEADVSLISRVEKTADDTTVSLDPNTLYVFPEMTSLSISLNTPKDTTIVNEYHFIFESGATATTFSLPSSLKVDAYSIDANKIYEVSILESICYIRGVASA